MSIRKSIQQRPALTAGVAGGLLVLAIVAIVYQVLSARPRRPGALTQAWYTVDDGASWFADDINRIPPFDHDGKQAVMSCMFHGTAGRPFVAYLLRYPPLAKANLEKLQAQQGVDPAALQNAKGVQLMECKKPLTGDKGWVPVSSTAGQRVMDIVLPPDFSGGLAPFLP